MAMIALLMRPWIIMMRMIEDVKSFILVDNLLVLAKGRHMGRRFATALNRAHTYLHDLGAKVSPSKSYNFSTNKKPKSG